MFYEVSHVSALIRAGGSKSMHLGILEKSAEYHAEDAVSDERKDMLVSRQYKCPTLTCRI